MSDIVAMNFYRPDKPENQRVCTPTVAKYAGLPIDNLDICKKAGYFPIYYDYVKDYDDDLYKMEPDGDLVYNEEKQEYRQAFKLVDLTEEEKAARQETKKQHLFEKLREVRDKKLEETDVYLIADYPISEENLELIKVYRQELRDLPEQEGAPWDGGGSETPWPVMPEVKD